MGSHINPSCYKNIYILITSCESLRDVDKEAALYLHLKPGQRLCRSCEKSSKEENATNLGLQDHMEMGDVEVGDMDNKSGTSTPKKVVIDTLNKSSEYLDFPPIKTAGLGKGLLLYGMRKVKQIKTAVKEKCAHAFQVSTDDLDTEVESCERCSHLERIITLLKEELRTSRDGKRSSYSAWKQTAGQLGRLITLLKEEVKNTPRWKKTQLLSLETDSWILGRLLRS